MASVTERTLFHVRVMDNRTYAQFVSPDFYSDDLDVSSLPAADQDLVVRPFATFRFRAPVPPHTDLALLTCCAPRCAL
jgi:hypothetical protein